MLIKDTDTQMSAEETGTVATQPIDRAALREMRSHLARRDMVTADQQAAWLADYLDILSRIMTRAGLGTTELGPLAEIQRLLAERAEQDDPDELHTLDYARASAEIAFLILTGTDEAEAAQRVSRQLLARGIPMPSHGGDARGWRRLLEFRDRLRHGQLGEEAAEAYRNELARLKAARS